MGRPTQWKYSAKEQLCTSTISNLHLAPRLGTMCLQFSFCYKTFENLQSWLEAQKCWCSLFWWMTNPGKLCWAGKTIITSEPIPVVIKNTPDHISKKSVSWMPLRKCYLKGIFINASILLAHFGQRETKFPQEHSFLTLYQLPRLPGF